MGKKYQERVFNRGHAWSGNLQKEGTTKQQPKEGIELVGKEWERELQAKGAAHAKALRLWHV